MQPKLLAALCPVKSVALGVEPTSSFGSLMPPKVWGVQCGPQRGTPPRFPSYLTTQPRPRVHRSSVDLTPAHILVCERWRRDNALAARHRDGGQAQVRSACHAAWADARGRHPAITWHRHLRARRDRLVVHAEASRFAQGPTCVACVCVYNCGVCVCVYNCGVCVCTIVACVCACACA
eukprot:361208-Chlamydomonas_euryale.AAC.2